MFILPRIAVLGLACIGAVAADLTVLPAHLRPDPFGAIVAPDRIAPPAAPAHDIGLETARASSVSCHLAISMPEGGAYQIDVQPFPSAGGIQIDLFREWFHYVPSTRSYYPDALIPVKTPFRAQLPDLDNHVDKQTTQAFWLDIWTPANARPGEYRTTATLLVNGKTTTVALRLKVLPPLTPDQDVIAMDHNSYGTSWFAAQYPRTLQGSDDYFRLIHAYHRIFYEHHGVFHQLGYGHAGKVGPEFAPLLEGRGKTLHIADWTAYDRHYGPLFDGSAFADTRRGARPIPFAYLPINPEWPASFVSWGEPGYEREFVNVVSEMERHFREKGWTSTHLEMFFNHKKRYKGFPWDGDETRFVRDYAYFKEYARLLKEAVPGDSPVKFVFRADASWTAERQFHDLAGIVNFWVVGGDEMSWLDGAPQMLKHRGDIVWIYGGTPPVTEASSHIALGLLKAWLLGVDGFVRWETTQPGKDPWFQFEGGGEALVYPGDRFGIAGPLASIRLKMERNAVQDLTLIGSLHGHKAEVVKRFNDTTPADWRLPRPATADRNPEDITNADFEDAVPRNSKFTDVDAAAWERVCQYALELARVPR
jgi:hypothetical protein